MIINWFYDLFDSITMSDLVAFAIGGAGGYWLYVWLWR